MGNHIEHPLEWDYDGLCVGLDEAGRGPIAGPVVIAGVIFEKGFDHMEIYDSKKTSVLQDFQSGLLLSGFR